MCFMCMHICVFHEYVHMCVSCVCTYVCFMRMYVCVSHVYVKTSVSEVVDLIILNIH